VSEGGANDLHSWSLIGQARSAAERHICSMVRLSHTSATERRKRDPRRPPFRICDPDSRYDTIRYDRVASSSSSWRSRRRPSRRCTTMSTVVSIVRVVKLGRAYLFFFQHVCKLYIVCILLFRNSKITNKSRGHQLDVWNRFVAGRASCSVDDQVGDATCGQEVG